MQRLKEIIEDFFDKKDQINSSNKFTIKEAVDETINLLNSGILRVCEFKNDNWVVNQWIKKAILLSFRLNENSIIESGKQKYFDKVPLKFEKWNENDFRSSGFRVLPGSVVRRGSFIAKNCVLMPSFVNIGAYIDEGTMIDTWSTIGSCAQIGKNCHISGGVGIGGVLEPLQANPVIIEDDCFIGARSEIAEGVIIGKGAVISMGVYIGASTKIINRDSKEIIYGKIPPYSVVVPGSISGKNEGDPNLYAAVIVKKVDEKTKSKTSINELLRY